MARWLHRAAEAARRLSDSMTRGYGLKELQADEIRTFIDRRSCTTWVDRRLVIGSRDQLDDALWRSEDSSDLNTSFVERLNLTIRQCSPYLSRRTPCHARFPERLAGHLELLRCHHSFIRPHGALKFGTEVRTPAMQAGLVSRRLSFREISMVAAGVLLCVVAAVDFRACPSRIEVTATAA